LCLGGTEGAAVPTATSRKTRLALDKKAKTVLEYT
jgi:hypothetical protein